MDPRDVFEVILHYGEHYRYNNQFITVIEHFEGALLENTSIRSMQSTHVLMMRRQIWEQGTNMPDLLIEVALPFSAAIHQKMNAWLQDLKTTVYEYFSSPNVRLHVSNISVRIIIKAAETRTAKVIIE